MEQTTELIKTDDWLLARDIFIRGQQNVIISDGHEDTVLSPEYFAKQLYMWQHFRITGMYPENYTNRFPLENAFFLFCTRSHHCFSFVDPSEMKLIFDANYQLPISIWKNNQIIRQFRKVGETFFSVVPVTYQSGKIIFNTKTPSIYVRRIIGSLTLNRYQYPELLEKLPDGVSTVTLTVNISLEFEHTVNIKLFGNNLQQWEGHGF